MPTFTAPHYSKVTNPRTGSQESCYTFEVHFQPNEECLTFIVESSADITLKLLQQCVINNTDIWNTFITNFLQTNSKLFSKPYTVEQINKICKHTLKGIKSNVSTDIYPVNVVFLPKTIQISGGVFMSNWEYTLNPILIDIPDVKEPADNIMIKLPVTNVKLENEIQELNMDDLPSENNSTEEALELDSPAKFYEKQMVKETRLKVKLAMYKAQRQLTKYYEKYGDDISDSECETSESECSEEDNVDDKESGDKV